MNLGCILACVFSLIIGACLGFIVSGLIFVKSLDETRAEMQRLKRQAKKGELDEYRL